MRLPKHKLPKEAQEDYDAVAAWIDLVSKTESDAEMAAIEHLRPAPEVFDRLDAYYDKAIVRELNRQRKIKRTIRH